MSDLSPIAAKAIRVALEGLGNEWLETALREIALKKGLTVEPGPTVNVYFIGVNNLGDVMSTKKQQGDHFEDHSSGNTMSKSFGTESTAENNGNLLHFTTSPGQDLSQLLSLFKELADTLREVDVPNRSKLEEVVGKLEEAKAVTDPSTLDKSRVVSLWKETRDWITSALGVGLFLETTAERIKAMVIKIGTFIP